MAANGLPGGPARPPITGRYSRNKPSKEAKMQRRQSVQADAAEFPRSRPPSGTTFRETRLASPTRRLTPRPLSSPACAIKTVLLVLASILPCPASAELAADAAPTAVLVDAGPHDRTWQTIRQIDTGHALIAETTQSLEIQTGLTRS